MKKQSSPPGCSRAFNFVSFWCRGDWDLYPWTVHTYSGFPFGSSIRDETCRSTATCFWPDSAAELSRANRAQEAQLIRPVLYCAGSSVYKMFFSGLNWENGNQLSYVIWQQRIHTGRGMGENRRKKCEEAAASWHVDYEKEYSGDKWHK